MKGEWIKQYLPPDWIRAVKEIFCILLSNFLYLLDFSLDARKRGNCSIGNHIATTNNIELFATKKDRGV